MSENQKVTQKSKVQGLTPKEIVLELDKFIIGQLNAKKSVAVALRNRARRKALADDLREEVQPKNIIMIGPTGVGKTEIARRLAKLAGAPFVKVEATKYTEVGYVGRDVESMVRDLVQISIKMEKDEQRILNEEKVAQAVEDRILDLLLPSSNVVTQNSGSALSEALAEEEERKKKASQTREIFRTKLKRGDLEDKEIEIEITQQQMPAMHILGAGGNSMDDMENNLQNMMSGLFPKGNKKRKVNIDEARKILAEEEAEKLIDIDKVQSLALKRAEEMGIIFLDEIDKICTRGQYGGSGEVSREGVQRDLLPIVEGATVNTKFGPISTDHILFIAAGAFHNAKVSDLIPELQGRFPIRVELDPLTASDFEEILSKPNNALTKQYQALLATENLMVEFEQDGVSEIARLAHYLNEEKENIGARRLHTILERIFEDISFDADELAAQGTKLTITKEFVQSKIGDVNKLPDLSRFIL